MARRPFNLSALFGAFTGALLAVTTVALADGALADGTGADSLNDLITADDIGTGHATPPVEGVPMPAAPPMPSAAFPILPDALAEVGPELERWVPTEDPNGALSVISVHPLPGGSCQDVLFDMSPTVRVRHAAETDGILTLDLAGLCLFGIRNDSDDRAIAIRLGEELRTVAIGIDSRLHAGLTISPGHEVLTPIRPMSLDQVDFDVEVVWDDLIDSGAAVPSAFHVILTTDPSQGS